MNDPLSQYTNPVTGEQYSYAYPISEIFDSIQGEGLYQGTPMTFIRFAGCSVGKPIGAEARTVGGLPEYAEMCRTYDGRFFVCDTDFRVKMRLSATDIVGKLPKNVQRICFTGGEPLIHDLGPLVEAIERHTTNVNFHLETSGTRPVPEFLTFSWVTISPKHLVIDEALDVADELKFLVDSDFNIDKVKAIVERVMSTVLIWIQPINYEFNVNRDNLSRCLEILKDNPTWRLSTQLHKIWGVR